MPVQNVTTLAHLGAVSKSSVRFLATATIILAALCASAGATPLISASISGQPTGAFGVNFDALPIGNVSAAANNDVYVTFSGDAGVVSGSSSGVYAAPYVNGNASFFGDNEFGNDTTHYLSTGVGSVTLSFTKEQNYLGLLWGSVDLYNHLTLFDGNNQIAAFSGGDVFASANGDQGGNGSYYVNISGLPSFDKAVFTSDGYAFEFDNVSYNVDPPASVPEPMTLSMFCAGLFGAGALRRRNKKASAVRGA